MAKKDRKGPRVGGERGLLDGLVGARLCDGEPVVSGARTVIPVARVRLAGGDGGGFGSDGGGGGGYLEATKRLTRGGGRRPALPRLTQRA